METPEDEIIEQLNTAEQLIYTNADFTEQIIDQTISIGLTTNYYKVKLKSIEIIHNALYLEKVNDFKLRVSLSTKVLPLVEHFLMESRSTHVLIISKIIDIFNSIYPLLFLHLIDNPDADLWNSVSALKEFLINQWPSSYPLLNFNYEIDISRSISVKVALIQFIGRVMQVQFPVPVNLKDKEKNTDIVDVSLSLVPRDHPFLYSSNLDIQAQALSDMLFGFLNDDLLISTPLFTSILTVLLNTFKKRPNLINTKLVNFILAYESQLKRVSKFEDANAKLKLRLLRRFNDKIDRIIISFLLNKGFINKDPNLKSRFENKAKYLDDKFKQFKARGILNDENDIEDSDIQQIKKRKLNTSNRKEDYFYNNSFIARENDYKSIYSLLNPNDELGNFDASALPMDILIQMVINALTTVPMDKLSTALNIVYERYNELVYRLSEESNGVGQDDNRGQSTEIATTNGNDVNKDYEDDDNYDEEEGNLADETYKNPLPNKLDDYQKQEHLKIILKNFIKVAHKPYKNHETAKEEADVDDGNKSEDDENYEGDAKSTLHVSRELNKIAIPNWNQDSWLIILIRLATRGSLNEKISNQIRDSLFDYFTQDLKLRLNGVIEWLNEEYYDFQVRSETDTELKEPTTYLYYSNKVMDFLIPFLESNDRKTFIQLLSEFPYLNRELIFKIKSLCFDPVRSKLGLHSLLYLIMFKPPVFQDCIDLLQEMSEEAEKNGNTTLHTECVNYLKKYQK